MKALKNSLKQFVKTWLRLGLNFVKGHPKLRLYITAVVRKLGLDGVAQAVSTHLNHDAYSPETGFSQFSPKDASHLTPSARKIYADLKAAIENQRKENR